MNKEEFFDIRWTLQDIGKVAEGRLNEEGCIKVLHTLKKDHDADVGINWSVIEAAIYDRVRMEDKARRKLEAEDVATWSEEELEDNLEKPLVLFVYLRNSYESLRPREFLQRLNFACAFQSDEKWESGIQMRNEDRIFLHEADAIWNYYKGAGELVGLSAGITDGIRCRLEKLVEKYYNKEEEAINHAEEKGDRQYHEEKE